MIRPSSLFAIFALAALVGCDSGGDAKLQEDQRHFHEVAQGQLDALQWRLDDSTAARIFDDNTQAGVNRYLTFRKCHEEPPTHEANKRVCAALQARVAKQEESQQAQARKEKAVW